MRLRSALRGRRIPCSMQHVYVVPMSQCGAVHVKLRALVFQRQYGKVPASPGRLQCLGTSAVHGYAP